jgi:hypothetical protein
MLQKAKFSKLYGFELMPCTRLGIIRCGHERYSKYSPYCVPAKVIKLVGLKDGGCVDSTQNGE